MTHYSDSPGHVRCDLFMPDTGKWKYTVELDMEPTGDDLVIEQYRRPDSFSEDSDVLIRREKTVSDDYDSPFTGDRIAAALKRQTDFDPEQWIIVVLDPYAKNGYPHLLLPRANRAAMGLAW